MPHNLLTILDALREFHGVPKRPVPKTAFEWILWENVAYLVPDEKREAAFAALKERTGLEPQRILNLPREALMELARLGGMNPEGRAQKLLDIAERVQEEHDGDLQSVLALSLSKARSALKKFPGIGAPGADKILLFTKTCAVTTLESNGLRTLTRLGLAKEGKSYAATYKSGIAVMEPHLERGIPWLIKAYQLLRVHGQVLCKHTAPHCEQCPLAASCPSAD